MSTSQTILTGPQKRTKDNRLERENEESQNGIREFFKRKWVEASLYEGERERKTHRKTHRHTDAHMDAGVSLFKASSQTKTIVYVYTVFFINCILNHHCLDEA